MGEAHGKASGWRVTDILIGINLNLLRFCKTGFDILEAENLFAIKRHIV